METSQVSESIEQFKDMVAGSIAGAISRCVEYPFDTIKVLYQTQDIQQSPVSFISLSLTFLQKIRHKNTKHNKQPHNKMSKN